MSEKDVQREVKRVLALHGYTVSDLSQPRATMQTPGLPDLYAQNPKRRIRLWVECKHGTNSRTPAQDVWHEWERKSGGTVATVWSGADMHAFLIELHAGLAGRPAGDREGANESKETPAGAAQQGEGERPE